MLNTSNILKLFSPGFLSGNIPVIIFIQFIICTYTNAQNLVPNSSFEDIVSCPNMEGQIYLAEPWFQPIMCSWGNVNDCSSSDLYNVCHVPNPPQANVGVPLNDFGYQIARTGNGYAGIGVWVDNGGRERIEVKLLQTLKENFVYCVSMHVVNKLAVSFGDLTLTNTSNLQFLFTPDSLIDNHPSGEVYYTPSVSNPDNHIISDTSNWTKISGCYLAIGNENYLTIGNFYNNSTSFVSNQNAEGAYYLIDDVGVELYNGDNCNCPEFEAFLPTQIDSAYFLPNVFSPNKDGINEVWTTNFVEENEYVIILNRWGIEIIRLNINCPNWNGEFLDKPLTEGVYFFKAFIRGEFKTGYIHLVR